MTQHLTWRHLKALHQLFTDSRTEAKILVVILVVLLIVAPTLAL